MALQFVGGAFLSSFFQGLCDRMSNWVISGEVLEFISGQNLNEELLQKMLEKLIITLNSVHGVLDDAEEKQINDRRVKIWLDELKDTVYEADDFLDLVFYGALKFQVECTNQVRNYSSSFTQLEDVSEENVNKILEKLEYLVKQKNILSLREGIGEKACSFKIPTTSLVDESGVFGRDSDKEFIMKLLMLDDGNCNVPGVIPIVGLGGVGKTTLAQLVYNDVKVQEWFELKAWVCVSEEFDVFKLTKDILQEVSSVNCDVLTRNQLQLELKKTLQGKKFLIVLDDVWNEKYRDWDILRGPMVVGAQGSKVIVTTRNESAASVMCTFPSHHIKELNDDDCWSLFAKHAFYDGNSRAYPMLEAMGKEIVRKLNGLPLAAKTLGGLLRCERDARKWERILKSNLWDLQNNEILPALELSYHYLPLHLKRCFAYCAIFPKDYEFQKDELVLLWMAEGFVVGFGRDEEMREFGEEYFDNLVSRSFLHKSSSRSCFVMHDLIHDLAAFVSGEFLCRLEDSKVVSKKARHLSCVRASNFEGLPLRTIICNNMEEENAKSLPKCLRVLSMESYKIHVLPDSIGNLIHLRYLNLSGASISYLPESVTSLYNLQSLILYNCTRLFRLPTDMASLTNLCCLDMRMTGVKCMPPNMGQLGKLQTLTNFIVEEDENLSGKSDARSPRGGSYVRELGKLQHLRGKLVIEGLGYILDPIEAIEVNLKGKKHLNDLELKWSGHYPEVDHDNLVLELLQPHTNLKCLSIDLYYGETFPIWFGDSSYSNLVSLKINNSTCTRLPPLGQLANLKDLSITKCGRLKSIGPEFFGSCIQLPFQSLEILRFENMLDWREWKDDGGGFPMLQVLYLRYCPKLKNALHSRIPSLTSLRLECCPNLVVPLLKAPILGMKLNCTDISPLKVKLQFGPYINVHEFPSVNSLFEEALSATLEEIEIENYDELQCFSLEKFPCLKRLVIRLCPNLNSLSASETGHCELTSLNSLEISRCSNFASFPSGGLCAPNLAELRLLRCSNLKSLPQNMQSLLCSLKHLRIESCPELESPPVEDLPSKLESLAIVICTKLKLISNSNNEEEDKQVLKFPVSLTYIRISSLRNQKSINFERLEYLTEMKISNCRNLRSLSENMQLLLPCLVKLSIGSCPFLENSFLQGGLPSKLESLEIRYCKNVIAGLVQYDLRVLPSLTSFAIAGYDDAESLPEETMLPSSLTALCVRDFKNLKSLGLQHLSSLKSLEIYDCNNLLFRPDEQLPSSLSFRRIKGCPLVGEMYKRDIGIDHPQNSRARII